MMARSVFCCGKVGLFASLAWFALLLFMSACAEKERNTLPDADSDAEGLLACGEGYCEPDERCWQEECIDNPCYQVACEHDEFCDVNSGYCLDNPCYHVECEAGKICDVYSGECIDDPNYDDDENPFECNPPCEEDCVCEYGECYCHDCDECFSDAHCGHCEQCVEGNCIEKPNCECTSNDGCDDDHFCCLNRDTCGDYYGQCITCLEGVFTCCEDDFD